MKNRSPTDNVILEVHQLSKSYATRPILDRVSLQLKAGRGYFIHGINGTGKTTLLRILAGLETPNSGRFFWHGAEMPWHKLRQQLFGSLIYLHQRCYLFDRDVRRNITYRMRCTKERLQHALRWAGVEDLAQQNGRLLSGGEAQRVALARAWIRQPCGLLLDEPTANMDRDSRQRTLALLADLKANGCFLLFSNHEDKHLSSLADHNLLLQKCRLVITAADKPPTADKIQTSVRTQIEEGGARG